MIPVNHSCSRFHALCSSLYTSIFKHVIPAGIHVRLSCLTPFGLMQIRSRRICAGIHDCKGRYFAQRKICIPHILVGYAEGRAMRGAIAEKLRMAIPEQDVGRNKAIQAHSARWRFRRIWMMFAGNASSCYRSNRLIPAYFCVTRVPRLQLPVLNSQAGAWELAQTGVQALLAPAGEACTPAFVRVPTGNLSLGPTSRLGIFSLLSFPRGARTFIHKSVQDRYSDLDVGRNKTARRQQGWAFPAIGAPETPVRRLTRGQAYSGLRRDVYNDERGAWKRGGDLTAVTQRMGARQI